MTRPKLVTYETRKQWQSVIDLCIKLMMSEGVRTNGISPRAKIRLKVKKGYLAFGKIQMPRHLSIPCNDDEYEIREYRAFTLLDFLAKYGVSFYTSKEIYKKRQRLLMELAHKEKELNMEDWTVRKDSLEYALDSDDSLE